MKRVDLTGRKFGRLTVVGYAASMPNGQLKWHCRCECGATRVVYGVHLNRGKTRSCGCYNNEVHSTLSGRSKGAASEYKTWSSMLNRCENPNAQEFDRYGARGIAVCDRWHDLECFLQDMGRRPSSKHSIDRINNNGDYEPGNCRWATRQTQQNNLRSNRIVSFGGKSLTVAQWARDVGCSWSVIFCRLERGWTVERALTQPVRVYRGAHAPQEDRPC